MIDLSIFLPAIRTPLWDRMYDSITESCTKYSWELVLCGPFCLTEYLKTKDNVKFVKDLGSPSRCAQLASFECDGKLLYHVVDDALFFPNSIDNAILFYNKNCCRKDAINMRYKEGENYSGDSMPMEYWTTQYHGPLRLPGIPKNFKISLHHMLDASYFRELGGYDCSFEYQNYNLHDFIFRLQSDGGIVYDSLDDVTTCNHFPGSSGDHGPINDAHVAHDEPLFLEMYSNSDILLTRKNIDINNWVQQSGLWKRRFKTIPHIYEELVK